MEQFLTAVQSIEAEEAKGYMAGYKKGTFTLLDVRQPGEYEKTRIPGARLIPLPELIDRLGELDPKKPVTAPSFHLQHTKDAQEILPL